MLGFLVGHDEACRIGLAIKAAQPFDLGVEEMKTVARIFTFARIVHDTVGIGTIDADTGRLVVDRMFFAPEAAFKSLQRAAAPEPSRISEISAIRIGTPNAAWRK